MQVNMEEFYSSGIYCIKNTNSNKIYVGSSKNMYHRLARHKSDLKKQKHGNPILQNSFNKYGEENFEFSVLEYCDSKDLSLKEQYYIDTLNPTYNITRQVYRLEIAEETRKKISETLKQKYIDGMPRTKIRGIDCYLSNGEFYKSYDSISDAQRDLKVYKNSINKVLKGLVKTLRGFQFFYSDEKYVVTKLDVNSIGRSQKRNKKTGREVKVKLTIIETSEEIIFESLKDLASHIGKNKVCIWQFLNKTTTNIYLGKYLIAPIKSCELLENLEIDNQQPSVVEI